MGAPAAVQVYYNKPSWTPDADPANPAKQTGGDSLEEAQCNKMSLICDRLALKPGDEYMDIGCGWGTLMRHAAREYQVKSTGVTLSVEVCSLQLHATACAPLCSSRGRAAAASQQRCEPGRPGGRSTVPMGNAKRKLLKIYILAK